MPGKMTEHSTTSSSNNRRQSHRARISIAVRLKLGGRVYLYQAANISTDGIFVASVLDETHTYQAKCLLEFSLPGSNVVITARGRILRQAINGRYHLTAIKFATIAPSHRRLIHRYIKGLSLPSPKVASRAPDPFSARI